MSFLFPYFAVHLMGNGHRAGFHALPHPVHFSSSMNLAFLTSLTLKPPFAALTFLTSVLVMISMLGWLSTSYIWALQCRWSSHWSGRSYPASPSCRRCWRCHRQDRLWSRICGVQCAVDAATPAPIIMIASAIKSPQPESFSPPTPSPRSVVRGTEVSESQGLCSLKIGVPVAGERNKQAWVFRLQLEHLQCEALDLSGSLSEHETPERFSLCALRL